MNRLSERQEHSQTEVEIVRNEFNEFVGSSVMFHTHARSCSIQKSMLLAAAARTLGTSASPASRAQRAQLELGLADDDNKKQCMEDSFNVRFKDAEVLAAEQS